MKYRFIIYFILLIAVSCLTYWSAGITNPQNNFTKLLQAKTNNPGHQVVRSSSGYLRVLPGAYICSLYVGDDSDYYPTQYIIVTRTPRNFTVELLNGPGRENTRVLKDANAMTYLQEHELEYSQLEKMINPKHPIAH